MALPALHVITIGEPKHVFARAGVAEYETRLARYGRFRLTHLRDSRRDGAAGRIEEGEALLAAAGRAYRVALDPRGGERDSLALTRWLANLATRGVPEVAFLIGGPDGLSEPARVGSNELWSLSALTLPHDLALVVVLEALYRAGSIERGEPYHR